MATMAPMVDSISASLDSRAIQAGPGSLDILSQLYELDMAKHKEIGVFETKTHLSEIFTRVVKGERFYVTKRGQRVAELRPVVGAEKMSLKRGCVARE